MKVEELAYHKTPLGELTLRRRTETLLQNAEVFEVKLGDEYLMSSLFTEGERQLSHLGLAELEGKLDVVIGGLGLGYTAVAALENTNVNSLLVIDKFQEVIDWHLNKLVPSGKILSNDKRCELRQGDFFELVKMGFDIFDPAQKIRRGFARYRSHAEAFSRRKKRIILRRGRFKSSSQSIKKRRHICALVGRSGRRKIHHASEIYFYFGDSAQHRISQSLYQFGLDQFRLCRA